MTFQQKFYGKTSIIGKTGLIDAINSFNFPISKQPSTQYNSVSHQKPTHMPMLIASPTTKRIALYSCHHAVHSVSHIQTKYNSVTDNQCNTNSINSKSSHVTVHKRIQPIVLTRKAKLLQEIAIRSINNNHNELDDALRTRKDVIR